MRIATFNVENLFTRYLFARGVDTDRAVQHGFSSEDLRYRLQDPGAKQITAQAMQACRADVFALQEVEDLDTLKKFRDQYLGGREAWPHAIVIDGNDPRRIDVGVLSRLPIVHARSWQHLWNPADDAPRFDRDCLEVDVYEPGMGTVTLYINHFKSMRAPNRSTGPGRKLTRDKRVGQSRAVKAVVRERFGDAVNEAAFVVLGDLNDHLEPSAEGRSGIRELVEWDAVENVVDRLPANDRWTHHFQGYKQKNLPPAHRQLDYILPSRKLAALNAGLPHIERRGLPRRTERFTGKRFEGIGKHRPKASDHCPVFWDIKRVE
ncbi:MAG: putative extracellular nuclease [Myxococcota bacterium]|jgi:predicted extracellular nuclease